VLRVLLSVPVAVACTLALGLPSIFVGLVDHGGRFARRAAGAWGRILLAIWGVRVVVSGRENVPDGPAVYAANHGSALDIPILFGHLPVDFRIIHKRSLYYIPVLGAYLWLGGHIGIDRDSAFGARRSLERAAERIRHGTSVAVFAEGTRSEDGSVRAFKRGSFFLASSAGVPVVPVSLAGVKRVVPRGNPAPAAGDRPPDHPSRGPHRGAGRARRGRAGPRGPGRRGPGLRARGRRRVRRRRRGAAVAALLLSCAAAAVAKDRGRFVRPPGRHRRDRGPAGLRRRLLGDRGAQPEDREGPLCAERRQEHEARIDDEAGHHGRGPRRLRARRAAADDRGDRGPAGRDGPHPGGRLSRGARDPELSGRFADDRSSAGFEEMAEALKAAGVRRIEGRLVGHEGLFSGDRRGADWSWGDLVWSYGAEVSALSFNDNAAVLTVSPGERAGDPVMVDRFPESRYYSVVSTATTSPAGSGNDLVLERDFGSNVIRLGGTLPAGGEPAELEVALEDPARYAATAFAEVLESKGSG
jgi:1-acyl-sn-glycerol-3-phosphate acyltransferase